MTPPFDSDPDDIAARKQARRERKARRRQEREARGAAERGPQPLQRQPFPQQPFPQQQYPPPQYPREQPRETVLDSVGRAMGPFGQRIARIVGNMILHRIIGMVLNAILRGGR